MDEELKKLLEKNLEYSQEIYKNTKYIKDYVFWAKIGGALKILIIVVPIVLGIIYLPSLLKSAFDQYRGLLGVEAGTANPIQSLLKGGVEGLDLNNIDINQLPANVRAMIK